MVSSAVVHLVLLSLNFRKLPQDLTASGASTHSQDPQKVDMKGTALKINETYT